MKYVLIIALPLLALVAVSPAQITWERVYGDSRSEANDVIQTSDGGYLVVGVTDMEYDINWLVSCNAFIIKTDEYGEALWRKTYGDSGINYINSVLETDDEDFIIAGYSNPYSEHLTDNALMLLLDNDGDTLWTRTYGCDTTYHGFYTIVRVSDGGYLTYGHSGYWMDEYVRPYASWLMRFDSYFNIVWVYEYQVLSGISITEVSDGSFIGVGLKNPDGYNHVAATKFGTLGDTIWARYYDRFFEEGDAGRAIVATPDNGAIIGFSGEMIDMDLSPSGGLIKIDSLGEVVWRRNFNPAIFDFRVTDVAPTLDGNYIISGYNSYQHAVLYGYAKLAKYSESGSRYWVESYCFEGEWLDIYHDFTCVASTDDGGYIAAGVRDNSLPPYDKYIYLVKTDSEGDVNWINEISIKPKEIFLSVYPNPFNSFCKITAPEGAKIEIIDLNGRIVKTLKKTPSIWHPDKSIGSGIYLVRAIKNQISTEKKIIYIQ